MCPPSSGSPVSAPAPDTRLAPCGPLDPARRHQIEQDVITAAWEVERFVRYDDNITILRDISDPETDVDGNVILEADFSGHNDLRLRIAAVLASHDPQEEHSMSRFTEIQTIILSAGA